MEGDDRAAEGGGARIAAPFAETPVMTVSPTRTGEPVMAACESGWIWVFQRSAPVAASIPSMFGPGPPSTL